MDSLIIIKCPYFSLVAIFVLTSILSDIRRAIPALFWLLFALYIFFLPFTFNLIVSLKFFLIHSYSLTFDWIVSSICILCNIIFTYVIIVIVNLYLPFYLSLYVLCFLLYSSFTIIALSEYFICQYFNFFNDFLLFFELSAQWLLQDSPYTSHQKQLQIYTNLTPVSYRILLLYCSTAFLPFLQQGCYTFYTYKCYKPKIHCYIIITLHTLLSFKEAKRRKESNYIFIVSLIFLSFLAFLFVPVDSNYYLESFPQPNAALFKSTSLVLLLENIFHVYML